jgi:electron transport complex protein RnfG
MSKEAKKSSIIKDAMVLFIITLIAGVSLGFVYELTLPAIEAQKLQAKTEAYAAVYADAAEFSEDETLTAQAAEAAEKILAPNGLNGVTIDEAFVALDGSGNKIGYVMSITTQNGYGGAISLSLGYSVDGSVTGMEILTINETAGMGAKAAEPEFKGQFAGKQAEQFELVKGGGASGDTQINAISGATITSTAVTDAVNSGLRFINEMAEAGNN